MTSNIRFIEYGRKTRIDAEKFDRFYAKYSDYQKDMGILVPKILGSWKLVFVDIRYQELEELLQTDFPNNWEITVYARKETLSASGALDSGNTLKPYEEFMQVIIANFPKIIDDKAANEIYHRCNGDLDLIASTMEALKELTVSTIRIEEVNAMLAPNNNVWASNVVASLFVFYNERIPRRGHPLAGLKWKKPLQLLSDLTKQIGEEIAFYAIQKQLRVLFELKVKYIHNEELGAVNKRQENLLHEVDIYSIFYAYCLFRVSNYMALQSIVTDIINRQSGKEKGGTLLYDRIYSG